MKRALVLACVASFIAGTSSAESTSAALVEKEIKAVFIKPLEFKSSAQTADAVSVVVDLSNGRILTTLKKDIVEIEPEDFQDSSKQLSAGVKRALKANELAEARKYADCKVKFSDTSEGAIGFLACKLESIDLVNGKTGKSLSASQGLKDILMQDQSGEDESHEKIDYFLFEVWKETFFSQQKSKLKFNLFSTNEETFKTMDIENNPSVNSLEYAFEFMGIQK